MANPFDTYPDDLVIQMIATGKYLLFRDGIDSFNRSYNINWESIDVYGRQDAIQTYQSTGESISVSWPLKPGTQVEEYTQQLKAILALGKFARPYYSDGSIIESPLLRIKYRNLIIQDYPDTPLLIAPNSITVDYGDRAREVERSMGEAVNNIIVPKRINITLNGMVINTTRKYYKKDSSADDVAGNSDKSSDGTPGKSSEAKNDNTRGAAETTLLKGQE